MTGRDLIVECLGLQGAIMLELAHPVVFAKLLTGMNDHIECNTLKQMHMCVHCNSWLETARALCG